MVESAKNLLVRMAKEYDDKKTTEFDSFFYLGVPGRVIDWLDDEGYIEKRNDIVGTIRLTERGYLAAKK